LSTIRVDVLQPNDERQRDDHRIFSVDAMRRSGAVVRHSTLNRLMNTATFLPPRCLGLSVRRFGAITGVQYETARHWGGLLMLEMMGP
jgi:hypothetical protein